MRLRFWEMDAAEVARFLSPFTPGYGDYTVERKQRFEGLTMKEAVQATRQSRDV